MCDRKLQTNVIIKSNFFRFSLAVEDILLSVAIEIIMEQPVRVNSSTGQNGKSLAGLRFNIFSIMHTAFNYCNISTVPYCYPRYGEKTRQRIFKVMYRECKVRLLIHAFQIIYLVISIIQAMHISFSTGLHDADEDENENANNYHCDNCCNKSMTNVNCENKDIGRSVMSSLVYLIRPCWLMIGKYLAHNRWLSRTKYTRVINLLSCLFVGNSIIQKLYYLFRLQQPIMKERTQMLKKHSGDSIDLFNVYYELKYEEFLAAPKMSLKEHVLYCFSNTDRLDADLTKKYPILRPSASREVDLMSIQQESDLLCSPKVYRYLTAFFFNGIVFSLLTTIAATVILTEERDDIRSIGALIMRLLKVLDNAVLISINALAFTDFITLLLHSTILSSRLAIFEGQLVHFIEQCRHKAKTITTRYTDRIRQYDSDRIFFSSKEKSYCTYITELNEYSRQHRAMSDFYEYNQQCVRMVTTLHQLMQELKRFKSNHADHTNLALFLLLCSTTWILCTFIVVYSNSYTGRFQAVLIFTGIVSVALLSSIIIQLFFLAQIATRVR